MKTTNFLLTIMTAVILFTGCGKDVDPPHSPATYEVSVTAGAGGTASADKAAPKEGEAITITAVADEGYEFMEWMVTAGDITLLPNAQANPATFIMPASNVEIRAEFKVAAPDDILTAITDPTFLAYARHRMTNTQDDMDEYGNPIPYPAWDTDGNGILSPAEAAAVEYISVHFGYPAESGNKVASFDGIEYFTGLKILNCDFNSLTELDITKNKKLESLSCDLNSLTELDVTRNTKLESLSCNYNSLTELDVTKNSALKYLDCASNSLAKVDVAKNSALETLNCARNLLTEVDVAANNGLHSLVCDNNRMSALDITNMAFMPSSTLYLVICGNQSGVDGTGEQTLTLTMREDQRPHWESSLKESYNNANVLIKGDSGGDNFNPGGGWGN